MKYTQDEIDTIIQAIKHYFKDETPDYSWYQKHISNMLEEDSIVEMCFYLDHQDVGLLDWDDFYAFLQLHVKY